ncbi:MAG: DUF1559 domain-containing protein, partial [Fuerstiella sp.]|nr:DUF1559 domain-containing protein [Fuerstiella sp.]
FLATAEIEESALGSTDKSFMQTLQQLASLYEQSGDAQKLASIQQRIAAADPLATVISHLPEGTFVAAAIQPSTLPADPGLQLLPFEVIEAAGIKEMGFNPLDVEAIIAFGTLPITDTDPPFHGGFVFKLKDGIKADYPWTTDMQPVKGQPYLKGAFGGPGAMCFVEFNDGAVLLGTEEAVRQSLASGGETLVGTMLQADRGQGQLIAAANLELVRPFVQMVLQDAPPVPPALEELKSIPVDTDTVQLWLNMSQGLNLSLILNSADDRKAARIAAAINSGLAFGQQMAMQEMEFELDDDDPVQAATRAYAQRIVKQYVNKLRPAVTGTSVAVELDAMEQSLAPVAVALLLPAVQAARGAAQQMQDSNSLKQIGLAMHNYHETYRKFPARGNYDRNGKPLLSWRVHLLPFLDQQQLYDQFKLDEPWDSDHNLPLAGQIPDVYRNKQLDDPTRTVFVTLDGKGTFMEGTKGLSFRDFTDGTSNTLMVVETNPGNAVVWTRPEDLVFDQNEPSNGVGLIRLQGFQALFTDGAVQMLSAEIDDETLRRLILRNDGEIVGDF